MNSQGRDGYVSLEVSPNLAFDTRATIDEAVRLYKIVGRDNVMIKVPGTPEGLPAIEELLSQGININITLLSWRESASHRVRGQFFRESDRQPH
jgi:transaldolase